MTLYIAPIVEGQTEQGCVERLLQRTWRELLSRRERLHVLQPSRGKRDALVDPSRTDFSVKIEEAFARLSQKLGHDPLGRGFMLVLLDAEHACPGTLAPRLLEKARSARSDADIACVLPTLTFENWIMGGASTLAGVNGLPDPLSHPDRFEDKSGVGWLKDQLRSKSQARTYKKTVDASAFVQKMNLAECRRNCPSFDKLCRELEARMRRRTGA
jgi:hypothetical protein